MSDEFKLDSILTGEKVSMSIAEKLAAKKKADGEKELYDKVEVEKRLKTYHEEQTGMVVPEGPSAVVDGFVEHMKNKEAEKIVPTGVQYNFSEPELIANQALEYYSSLSKKEDVNNFIELLEGGKILTKDSTFIDEELANVILVKVIEHASNTNYEPYKEIVEPLDKVEYKTSDAFATIDELNGSDIKLEGEGLHLADAYEQKVQDAIDKYADELLADSVRMFAEAMNFDPRFCDVIVRGDTQFFREVEDMGFPTLALMVKGIMKDRTEPI